MSSYSWSRTEGRETPVLLGLLESFVAEPSEAPTVMFLVNLSVYLMSNVNTRLLVVGSNNGISHPPFISSHLEHVNQILWSEYFLTTKQKTPKNINNTDCNKPNLRHQRFTATLTLLITYLTIIELQHSLCYDLHNVFVLSRLRHLRRC